jgi:ankyrin repeat protein
MKLRHLTIHNTRRTAPSAISAITRAGMAVVRALLNAGAEPNIRNDNSEQAVSLATAIGRDDLVQLLQSHPKPRRRLFGLF